MPNVRSKGPVIGLTGGMGSGKSTVLAMFRKKGAFVLDADAIVKELLDKNKSVKDRIKKEFGPETVDAGGNVNKRTLARRVFSSARQRKKLERILHPLVRREIWSALRKHWGNRLTLPAAPATPRIEGASGIIMTRLDPRPARRVSMAF